MYLSKEKSWEIISDIVRNEPIEEIVIYEDKDGEDILVADNDESIKKLNDLLIERLQDIEYELKIASARTDKDEYFVNLLTEGNWTYSDEGFVCNECYKWYYYDEKNAVGYANFMIKNGLIFCEDCVKENKEYREMYINDLLNNYKNANVLLDYEELLDEGFEEVNKDFPFENGMYGDNDNPQRIMEKVMNEFPEYDYIFSIVKIYNPFTTQFNLYRREKEYE